MFICANCGVTFPFDSDVDELAQAQLADAPDTEIVCVKCYWQLIGFQGSPS